MHVLVKVMSIKVAFVKVVAMVKVEVVVLRVLVVRGAVLLQFQHAELQVLRSLLRLAQLLPQSCTLSVHLFQLPVHTRSGSLALYVHRDHIKDY